MKVGDGGGKQPKGILPLIPKCLYLWQIDFLIQGLLLASYKEISVIQAAIGGK